MLTQAGAAPSAAMAWRAFGPTGVQEQGAGTRGSLGNLRDPAVSTDISGSGTGIPISPCPRLRVPAGGSKSVQGWYRHVKATKRGEMSGRESERPIVATKWGNSTEGPHGAKGTPFQTTVGGKHGGCIGTRGRVHETTTDSGTRSAKPGDGIHVPGLLHRHRLDARGVPAYAQGRGGGRGRTERRGLCGGPGGQPPIPAGTSQIRRVPGASGASGPNPQGRIGDRDSAAGYTDLRG